LVPEASLTLSALFSGAPNPSLLLQGEWRPLSHPPMLPCPHSTPWRIFQQPLSCLPCVVALYDKPQWEGGREKPEREFMSQQERQREGCLDHRGPVPRIGHTCTLRPRAASVHTVTPPQTQIHLYKSTRAGGMGATDCSGRGHTQDTCSSFIEYKSQTCKAGDKGKTKIILLMRRMSPNLPGSDQASKVNRL
jgi:hypothetical protein